MARVCQALENAQDDLHLFGPGCEVFLRRRAGILGYRHVFRVWSSPGTAALLLTRGGVNHVFFACVRRDRAIEEDGQSIVDDLYLGLAMQLSNFLSLDDGAGHEPLVFIGQGASGAAAQRFAKSFVDTYPDHGNLINEIITFGSPPPGDEAWAAGFTTPVRRFVVRGDTRVARGAYPGKLQFLAVQPRVLSRAKVLSEESDAWTNLVEDTITLASPLLNYFPALGVFLPEELSCMSAYVKRLELIYSLNRDAESRHPGGPEGPRPEENALVL